MTPPPVDTKLRLSGSGKDVSPRILSQYDLKIQEVGQRIREVVEKIIHAILTTDHKASTWITIHSQIGQLQQKAKIARKVTKDEPKLKQYREAYISLISLEYRNAAQQIAQAYSPNSGIDLGSYKEVKEILEKINHLI